MWYMCYIYHCITQCWNNNVLIRNINLPFSYFPFISATKFEIFLCTRFRITVILTNLQKFTMILKCIDKNALWKKNLKTYKVHVFDYFKNCPQIFGQPIIKLNYLSQKNEKKNTQRITVFSFWRVYSLISSTSIPVIRMPWSCFVWHP